MSDITEANHHQAESRSVPYFGELADTLGKFAIQHGLFNRANEIGRGITGQEAAKDGLLPSVEFINSKGENEKDTPFNVNGQRYEIDDSPSDRGHLYRVDYDGRRDAIEPEEAARARAAFQELEKQK